MEIAAILNYECDHQLKKKLESMQNVHIYYWLGPLFDIEELEYAVKDYKNVYMDDRLYEQFEPILQKEYFLMSTLINSKESNHVKPINKNQGKILFVASNDTHVKFFENVSKRVENHQYMAIDKGESADTAYKKLNKSFELFPVRFKGLNKVKKYSLKYFLIAFQKTIINYFAYKRALHETFARLRRENITVIVLGNDWAREEKLICHWAKENEIKTVCIQEGPLDFSTEDRMRQAEYAFMQGAFFTNYLKRSNIVFTGNPRFPMFKSSQNEAPRKVMVNCNFTYGVHEDKRDNWIKDIVDACNELDTEYFISKHPRDSGDYSKYNVIESNAFKLSEQLDDSKIVISRFSTVIYEALLKGKSVIYYNPHGEDGKPFTDDETGAILFAKDKEDIKKYIVSIFSDEYDNNSAIEEFLLLHCGRQDGKVNERVSTALNLIRNGSI